MYLHMGPGFPCLWLSALLLFAAPDRPRVVNAADYSEGGVAAGEVVVIYDSQSGPANMVPWGLDANLHGSTSIGETRVWFDETPATLVYAVSGRIGAVVPYTVTGKKTTEMVVEYRSKRSEAVVVPVLESVPALFTLDASGKGQAAMLNDTGCCNSSRNPAVRGTEVSLYATGEGQLPPGRVASNISVTVGGARAKVVYTGLVGSLQVNFRVPENAPVGDRVPLVLTVGDRQSPPGVTMAIRSAKQRILVLAKHVQRLELLRVLRGAGYEVSTAAAGEPPDLVMFELSLPREEVEQTLRTLRDAQPKVRTIALSGSITADALKAADLLGAQALLVKSGNQARILAQVRAALRPRASVY